MRRWLTGLKRTRTFRLTSVSAPLLIAASRNYEDNLALVGLWPVSTGRYVEVWIGLHKRVTGSMRIFI